jgi:hypothetical protein
VKTPTCRGCGLPRARGRAAFVLGLSGVITHTEVCDACHAAGFTLVVERSAVALAPWARYIRRLAEAYDGTERAEGMRQMPAGSFGRKLCSACRQPTLPGVT